MKDDEKLKWMFKSVIVFAFENANSIVIIGDSHVVCLQNCYNTY